MENKKLELKDLKKGMKFKRIKETGRQGKIGEIYIIDAIDTNKQMVTLINTKTTWNTTKLFKDFFDYFVPFEEDKLQKQISKGVLDEFLQGKLVVNCKTENEARELFKVLIEKSIQWSDGDKLDILETDWKRYSQQICYNIDNKKLSYTSMDYYLRHDYKVIPFNDLFTSSTQEIHTGDRVKIIDGIFKDANLEGIITDISDLKSFGIVKVHIEDDNILAVGIDDIEIIKPIKEEVHKANINEDIAMIKCNKTETLETEQYISKDKIALKVNNTKSNDYIITYKRKGNKIICEFKNNSVDIIVGKGIAKCNPNDEFDYGKGILLSELRARSDFYKKLANVTVERGLSL